MRNVGFDFTNQIVCCDRNILGRDVGVDCVRAGSADGFGNGVQKFKFLPGVVVALMRLDLIERRTFLAVLSVDVSLRRLVPVKAFLQPIVVLLLRLGQRRIIRRLIALVASPTRFDLIFKSLDVLVVSIFGGKRLSVFVQNTDFNPVFDLFVSRHLIFDISRQGVCNAAADRQHNVARRFDGSDCQIARRRQHNVAARLRIESLRVIGNVHLLNVGDRQRAGTFDGNVRPSNTRQVDVTAGRHIDVGACIDAARQRIDELAGVQINGVRSLNLKRQFTAAAETNGIVFLTDLTAGNQRHSGGAQDVIARALVKNALVAGHGNRTVDGLNIVSQIDVALRLDRDRIVAADHGNGDRIVGLDLVEILNLFGRRGRGEFMLLAATLQPRRIVRPSLFSGTAR